MSLACRGCVCTSNPIVVEPEEIAATVTSIVVKKDYMCARFRSIVHTQHVCKYVRCEYNIMPTSVWRSPIPLVSPKYCTFSIEYK